MDKTKRPYQKSFLIKSNLDKPKNYYKALWEVRDIYHDPDMDSEYQNLALVYLAKGDLMYADYQHYCEGANNLRRKDKKRMQPSQS